MTFGDRWERLVSPMRQKQPERLKEALAEEVAEAEAVKKAGEELLLEKQLSLLAKLQRNVSKRRSGRSNQECCSALEAAQKAEEESLHALPFFARMSHSSKEAAVLATVSITGAAIEEALARAEEMMAHRSLLRLQHQKQQP